MIDRTSKIILVAIALGLWANVSILVFRPIPAIAQNADLSDIRHDLHAIFGGICINSKIC